MHRVGVVPVISVEHGVYTQRWGGPFMSVRS